MYTSFSIKNFRGFEQLELNDLARINLIAGKNNTGKTSLLEAIFFHAGNPDPYTLLRLNDAIPYETSASLEWSVFFNDSDIAQAIELIGKNKATTSVVKLTTIDQRKYPELYKQAINMADFDTIDFEKRTEVLRLTFDNKDYYLSKLGSKFHLSDFPRTLFSCYLLSAGKSLSYRTSANLFSNLKLRRRENLLLSALQVIEPKLTSIELLLVGELMIYGEIGLSKPVPFGLMGEGINRIASLVLSISNIEGGVVLIDEIENGLHYSVLTDVWRTIGKAAREFDVQIFATTHSLECINAAQEAFSGKDTNDFRYHRLDRKKSGEIQAVTYDPETLDSSLESNLEVR